MRRKYRRIRKHRECVLALQLQEYWIAAWLTTGPGKTHYVHANIKLCTRTFNVPNLQIPVLLLYVYPMTFPFPSDH